MKKSLFIAILISAAMGSDVQAANLAVIASPPTMFNLFVLIVAGACLFGSFQVMGQVKGGYLSRSWQMFFLGFVLLAISQLASIASAMEFFSLPELFTPLMLLLMSGLFAFGVFSARNTLS